MATDFYTDKHYWIIGASDGIGAALARALSARGARLTLSARRADALAAVAEGCAGPVTVHPLDLADLDAVTAAVATVGADPLDGVISVAALYDPGPMAMLDLAKTETLFRVNVVSNFALAKCVPPVLRPGGQLVFFGSVAGYVGLPKGQPYSASKAAIISLAESLRVELSGQTDVRLICPGFVRTRLTDQNDFTMPDIIAPEEAAREIADGLARPGFEVHFPKRFTRKLKLLRALPYGLAFRVIARMV